MGLKTQNEKFRILVENNQKQNITVKQHKSGNKYEDLLKENQMLRDELSAYQAMDQEKQNNMNQPTPFITIQIPENSPAHRVQFMQTPLSPFTPASEAASKTYDNAYDIIAFKDSLGFNNIEEIEEWEELDNLHGTPNTLILKQRLEQIEIYRNDLIQKLNMIDSDDEKCNDLPIEHVHDSWFGIKGNKSESKLSIDMPSTMIQKANKFNLLMAYQYRY